MLSKSKLLRIFFEIILCQILLIAILGMKKPSFFVDEIWTYNLANANYFPAFANVDGYFYNWVRPDFWHRLIVVDSMNTFDYGSVWYNQAHDVLPPFFYAVVHTVASFFPLEFSIWFVLGPNLVFFIATQFVILAIAVKLFGRSWQALMPSIIYGFTLGGINSVLYFRMYMMLTFFGSLAFYLHLLAFDYIKANSKGLSVKYLCAITLVDVCGFLTHYYFIIFAFFTFVVSVIYLHKTKLYNVIVQYFGASVLALVLSVLIFPPCLKQIAGVGEYGYRGAQSFNNAFNSKFLEKLAAYNGFLARDLGGDLLLLLLMVIVCMVLKRISREFMTLRRCTQENKRSLELAFFKPRFNYTISYNGNDVYVIFAMLVSLAYYFTIVKISVMNDDRYIFIILPLFVLWGSYLINRIVTKISGKQYLAMLMCVTTVWFSAVASFRISRLQFADMEVGPAIANVEQNYSEVPMLVVNQIPHWHPIIEHLFLVEKASMAYLTTEHEIDKVKKGLSDIEFEGEELLAFVTWECKKPQKEILDELKQATGFKKVKPLYTGGDYKRGYLYLLIK